MSAPTKERITQEEFNRILALPENQNRRLELWNGEIIETMPKTRHAFIQSLLAKLFGNYFDNMPVGAVFTELQVELEGEDYSPVPDVAVILNEQGAFDWNEALPFVPALIVEIQSPGESDRFMREKSDYYLQRGCQMVITIFLKPVVEVVTVTAREILVPGDMLTGGDVLPGFSVEVRALFPKQEGE
ncbi:MAG: Uma2 family endonuclease [Anaerolineae bacterium]|nr:Uma2 family endonuclease [Anaerolineae bacterium]